MSKNISHRIFAISMVLLVLISSTGFTVDFHYCQGHLKSFSLFGKAKNCHEMASKKAACKHHQKESVSDDINSCIEDKNCCNNKSVCFKSTNDNQLLSTFYLSLDFPFAVILPETITFAQLRVTATEKIALLHYKPPLIKKDIRILFESFLI